MPRIKIINNKRDHNFRTIKKSKEQLRQGTFVKSSDDIVEEVVVVEEVKVNGDVNGDGHVDEKDLSIVHTEYSAEKKAKEEADKKAKEEAEAEKAEADKKAKEEADKKAKADKAAKDKKAKADKAAKAKADKSAKAKTEVKKSKGIKALFSGK